jgi:hypothetical protein
MKSQGKQTNVEPQTSDEGGSWQFKFVMIVIALGLIGIVVKAMGVF